MVLLTARLPSYCGLLTFTLKRYTICRGIIYRTQRISSSSAVRVKLQGDDTRLQKSTRLRKRHRKALARKQAESKDTARETIAVVAPNSHSFFEHLNAYVTCHPGLEPFLSQELNLLGIKHSVGPKRHHLKLESPSASDLFRCHLLLGTASQILVSCGEDFGARGWPELQRKVEMIPWNEILQKNIRLETKISALKSKLYHTTAIQERIESSICKVLGQDVRTNEPVKESSSSDSVTLQVLVQHDRVQLYLSSLAAPLHRRQYRLETAKAPLREDLAYAFLWSAGLRPAYFEPRNARMYDAVLDPFCGAGTVAIEAATMMMGLPPGRLLPAPFQGSTLHNPREWNGLVHSAAQKARTERFDTMLVSASDRDAGSFQATVSNAIRAGVIDAIQVSKCAFSSHPWFENPSEAPRRLLIAANLPFGRRTTVRTKKNDIHPLLPMYQKLSGHLNSLSENGCKYNAIFLTDNPTMLKRSGLDGKTSTQFKVNHGGIPVYALTTTARAMV